MCALFPWSHDLEPRAPCLGRGIWPAEKVTFPSFRGLESGEARREQTRLAWASPKCSLSAGTRVLARGLPSRGAVSHPALRQLQPPPAGPLQRRRHCPAPGRSVPPPHRWCRRGRASEPPRGTCSRSLSVQKPGSDPYLGPSPLLALWPCWGCQS